MPVNQVQLQQMNAQAMTPEEQAIELRRKMEEYQAQRMADEQAGIDAYNQQIAQYEQEPQQVNLAPLSALVANITGQGQGIAQALQANAPESASDKRKNLAAMRTQLQSMKSGLSKSQFETMKDRLASLKEKQENPFKTEMELLRLQALAAELEAKKRAAEKDASGTDAERAAAGFSKRLEQAETVFSDLAGKGYNRASGEAAAEAALSKVVPFVKGSELARQQQAEDNFLNAVLRKESGASISAEERAGGERQYFPRPGDDEKTLAQKKANRLQALENIKLQAGRAYDRAKGVDAQKKPTFEEWKKMKGL